MRRVAAPIFTTLGVVLLAISLLAGVCQPQSLSVIPDSPITRCRPYRVRGCKALFPA